MRRSQLNAIPHTTTSFHVYSGAAAEIGPGMALQVTTFTVGGNSGLSLPDGLSDGVRHGDFAAVANLVSLNTTGGVTKVARQTFPAYSVAGGIAVRALAGPGLIKPDYDRVEIDSFGIRSGSSYKGNSPVSDDYRRLISALLLDVSLRHFSSMMVLRVSSAANDEAHSSVSDSGRPVGKEGSNMAETSLHSHRHMNPEGLAEETGIIDHQVLVGTAQDWAQPTLRYYGVTVQAQHETGDVHRQLRHYGPVAKKVLGQ